MRESKRDISDPVYALVGAAVLALLILGCVAIIKPILQKANESRLAHQETQVSVVKEFIKECRDTSSVSTIILNGYLLDGKKRLKIEMILDYSVDKYSKYSLMGNYRYTSQPKDNVIELSGTCLLIEKTLSLFSKDGKEVFDLTFNEENQSFEGSWSQYKNRRNQKKDPDSFLKRLDCLLEK